MGSSCNWNQNHRENKLKPNKTETQNKHLVVNVYHDTGSCQSLSESLTCHASHWAILQALHKMPLSFNDLGPNILQSPHATICEVHLLIMCLRIICHSPGEHDVLLPLGRRSRPSAVEICHGEDLQSAIHYKVPCAMDIAIGNMPSPGHRCACEYVQLTNYSLQIYWISVKTTTKILASKQANVKTNQCEALGLVVLLKATRRSPVLPSSRRTMCSTRDAWNQMKRWPVVAKNAMVTQDKWQVTHESWATKSWATWQHLWSLKHPGLKHGQTPSKLGLHTMWHVMSLTVHHSTSGANEPNPFQQFQGVSQKSTI